MSSAAFDPACQRCERLAGFLDSSRARYPSYHCAPVAPFGDDAARLIVVGLAPGLHGANATGRPFTGDHAGVILYETLHRFGFASSPQSVSRDDGLQLIGARITNAVKCVPPANKPLPAEIAQCNGFLATELAKAPADAVLVALGRIAHEAILRALGLPLRGFPFAHEAEHALGSLRLIDSYHCSRYNTQTRRLTPAMFDRVFARARALLEARG